MVTHPLFIESIMKDTKTSLLGGGRTIQFFDENNKELCSVEFDGVTTRADSVEFSIGGGSQLSGKVVASGNVSKFVIKGKVNSQTVNMFEGSVGMTSSSDIIFNRVSWNADEIVYITNFTIYHPGE